MEDAIASSRDAGLAMTGNRTKIFYLYSLPQQQCKEYVAGISKISPELS
jgi:hypothetical protein